MRILLLEDDIELNESVSEYLCSLGYEVDSVADGALACDKIANGFYHLFILDIKVPNINGLEVMKYIKNLDIQTPIMIMTSLVDINDMAICYELGCNEYLKKPFELAELKLRVAELLRKYYNVDDRNIVYLNEDFSFNIHKRTLFDKNNNAIDLSAKELQLVEYLISHLNVYVSIADLIENVWENKNVEEADIRMHVLKIRNKTSSNFISSKRRIGYKIDAKKT
ncbi:two-component system response regulator [Campylobacter pinnipediorum subsp. pinnipediorum]|uniref:response regulator transcription factor n=1 Tax=Campylobacter pinnipediorum TaxID=1965231 RepID=UPI0009958885|nr:response regulator transcription factor [Campylobacter pinnipediorum]OPA76522.1 two-component system response regulator [Campylobacter pinnipediorum subsp. pinnipediorum]